MRHVKMANNDEFDRMWKKMEASFFLVSNQNLSKTMQNLMLGGLQAEIRTKDLPNVMQECQPLNSYVLYECVDLYPHAPYAALWRGITQRTSESKSAV
jgi:hypothetical protein